MQKISKFFLLLLLFNAISGIREVLEKGDKTPSPMKIGSLVEFDKNRNYFQFDFDGPNNTKLFFNFPGEEAELYLTAEGHERKEIKEERNYNYYYYTNLTYNGTYY